MLKKICAVAAISAAVVMGTSFPAAADEVAVSQSPGWGALAGWSWWTVTAETTSETSELIADWLGADELFDASAGWSWWL
ncbi:hypothetical protein HNR23_003598 [Nocardiopsis mwathae]|uniref:Uncharacterized protein n=1 Tax=Nocardiopsis mwathae TaxID=1472723 RepID=A0A7X0D6P3_9ACTN|nr:hypothetical protein [Nocardiopsis mwathae]MBB6173538.1 hypothetical protein [Nocardiopsis mwathae]